MRNSWTRERVIRHILEREAGGRPLTTGGKGVDNQLYSASWRIFGSWRNAILAAGIPPDRVLPGERWTPGRILAKIRLLSRRPRPLTTAQVERRYQNLASAARRHFGSWSKAVLAAGIDPAKLQRVVPWNRERVIEAILTRALRDDSLAARRVEPRSLVEAGQRYFGSWLAAVAAAGLDPMVTKLHPRSANRPPSGKARTSPAVEPRATWNKERVIEAIRTRIAEHRPMYATGVWRDDARLYAAAQRHLNSWDEALRAAGLDPADYRRRRANARRATEPSRPVSAARTSQDAAVARPNQSG